MIDKFAHWYANIGKAIFLYIFLVLTYITIGLAPIGFIVGAVFMFKYDINWAGFLFLFGMIIVEFIFILVAGVIKGEIILFEKINSSHALTHKKPVEAPKKQTITPLYPTKPSPVKKTKEIVTEEITDCELIDGVQISSMDTRIIPAGSKGLIKSEDSDAYNVAFHINGLYTIVKVPKDKLKK